MMATVDLITRNQCEGLGNFRSLLMGARKADYACHLVAAIKRGNFTDQVQNLRIDWPLFVATKPIPLNLASP